MVSPVPEDRGCTDDGQGGERHTPVRARGVA